MGHKWKCDCEQHILQSKYEGEYVSCPCGNCSIDETKHYVRMIGLKSKLAE